MKFQQRIIQLIGEMQRNTAIAMINNLPLGQNIEIVARETPKVRTLDQNALMWAGPLKDISEQVFENNIQYTDEAWNEIFKILYMPDEATEPYIHELVKNPETYRKWVYLPNGDRRCFASTTQLTKHGFSIYLEQIYVFGAEKGVMFSTNKIREN